MTVLEKRTNQALKDNLDSEKVFKTILFSSRIDQQRDTGRPAVSKSHMIGEELKRKKQN